MIRFQYEESIAASPARVFAVMSDIERFDEWLTMDGRPDPGRPSGVGARFASTARMGPKTLELDGEVTRYDPDRAFGFRVATPHAVDFEVDFELRPDGDGTRLVGSGSMTTHRLWRLLEPMLRSELPKSEAAEARRLKALVESGR